MTAPKLILKTGGDSTGRQARANSLPLVVSLTIILSSLVAFVLFPSSEVTFGLLAYFLTAVGTALCLAWDSLAQRRGMKNPNFTANRMQARILQLLALVGVAAAAAHIFKISETAAEFLSELWGLT